MTHSAASAIMPLMQFEYPPSLKLANLPTPVERHARRAGAPRSAERLHQARRPHGLRALGKQGAQARVLPWRRRRRRTRRAVITCGGIQSNHSRATVVAAARLGLRPVLVLRGAAPAESDGNVLLDRLAGAEIQVHHAGRMAASERDHGGDRGGGSEPRARRRTSFPEGASYPPGVFGYIRAAQEIAEAEKALGIEFDSIVTAVGSGGTSAGLLYGKRIFGLKANVLGINVLDTPAQFANASRR